MKELKKKREDKEHQCTESKTLRADGTWIYWLNKNIAQYSVYNNAQLIYNSNHINKATNYKTNHYSDP
jgi:hypothetical protein